jgi:hypothetical protein
MFEPIFRHVQPSRVARFYEPELFLSRPPFDLCLTLDGRPRIGGLFKVDQAIYTVTCCEGRQLSSAMLVQSAEKIPSDTHIYTAG